VRRKKDSKSSIYSSKKISVVPGAQLRGRGGGQSGGRCQSCFSGLGRPLRKAEHQLFASDQLISDISKPIADI
jgi:hypothetical protein